MENELVEQVEQAETMKTNKNLSSSSKFEVI